MPTKHISYNPSCFKVLVHLVIFIFRYLSSYNYLAISSQNDQLLKKSQCFTNIHIYIYIFIYVCDYICFCKIDGKLEAPKMVREWGNYESKCWLCFTNVKGLVLNGSGILHPHGEAWWSSIEHSHRPRVCIFFV